LLQQTRVPERLLEELGVGHAPLAVDDSRLFRHAAAVVSYQDVRDGVHHSFGSVGLGLRQLAMRGLDVDGGQLRQHGTGRKSRTVRPRPARQLPDDLVAADTTGVLQWSTLRLRPPKAQDRTEI